MLQVQLILVVVFLIHNSIQLCDHVTFRNIQVNIKQGGLNEIEHISGCITPEKLKIYKHELEHMDISGQNIPELKRGAVANFSDAFIVQFRENNLHTIKSGAFLNLTGLKQISITDNDLSTIEAGAFTNLQALKTINLTKNKLSFLEPSTFNNLPMLLSIELQHNHLQYFEQEWFTNTSKIQLIDISHNYIITIPRAAFVSLPSVEWIELPFNKIQQIHKNAFQGLENLLVLNLSHNRIKTFSVDFSSLKSIEELLLQMNNFTYIPGNILNDVLPTIRYFIVFPNPLQCPCYDKLAKWGYDNNIVLGNYTSTGCINKNNPICISIMHETKECLEQVDSGTNEYLNNKYYGNFNFNCEDN